MDTQKFARMCHARSNAGLILEGEWTRPIRHELKADGCIWDQWTKRWLAPNVAILNKYLAKRDGLEAADIEPDVRAILAAFQGEQLGSPWPADLDRCRELFVKYGREIGIEIARRLRIACDDDWGNCYSLQAALRAFGRTAIAIVMKRHADEEERKRNKIEAEIAKELKTAEEFQMRAAKRKWDAITEDKRTKIKQTVAEKHKHLKKDSGIFHNECLREVLRK